MILAALNDYYRRLVDDPESGISLPGYSLEKISYAIVLDRKGSLVSVDDIRDISGGKPQPRLLSVPASFKRPGIGSKPFFLWDKTSYALGVGAQADRNGQNFSEFKRRHEQELVGDDAGFAALLSFLKQWNPNFYLNNPAFFSHGESFLDTNVVFRLDGDLNYLHERPAARSAYAGLVALDESGVNGICMVSGRKSALARLHPSIKGINGTKNAETSIVSFNASAYLSYRGSLAALVPGKKENNSGLSAPVSVEAAEAYTSALNFLLRSKRQRLNIGDTNVVFWAKTKDKAGAVAAEDLFAEFLDPKDEDAQQTGRLHDALEIVRQGLPITNLSAQLDESAQIFVLGLAPNASRLSIRFWETGSLQMFMERLAAHYKDLELQPSPWNRPPAIWRLLLATAPNRDGKAKSEDVPPQLAGELARAVLSGRSYPYSLMGILVMRIRADHDEKAFGIRAALIKAVLVRAKRLGKRINHEGDIPVSLDASNADPGYLLGRLFSLLESIQRAALGKQINATIRDRYYGAASATPASVFPVLVRSAQHHLARLRKDKPGFAVNLERELGEIFDMLGTAFPRGLCMEAQGHFAIGYYHQTQARFVGKSVQDDSEEFIEAQGDNA